jgi:hypothetical protein
MIFSQKNIDILMNKTILTTKNFIIKVLQNIFEKGFHFYIPSHFLQRILMLNPY